MEKKIVCETELFDLPVCAEVTRLDAGIHVLLTGGSRTHIGAFSMAEPDGTLHTTSLPGHKEAILSEKWAGELCMLTGENVCVAAGIHYDNLTKEQIQRVVEETDRLLEECKEECLRQGVGTGL